MSSKRKIFRFRRLALHCAKLLQILREPSIAFDQNGAPARACKGRADGTGKPITHAGQAFIGDDALAVLLREGLHHHGEGRPARARE